MSDALYYIFMFISVLSTVMFLGLAWWYLHVERRERIRNAQRKADIADIMILFQTMRDVISQQKNLARDFNQELDRKMGLVKEVLAKSLEKNEKLYERQTEIQRQLDEVRAQLEGVQRQTGYLKSPQPQPQTRPLGASAPIPARPTAPPQEPVHIVKTAHAPATPSKRSDSEHLAKTGITDAPYSVWFGLDFDSAPPQAAPEEDDQPLPTAPTEPEDPEAARNAFRALLNLPSTAPAAAPAPQTLAAMNNTQVAPDQSARPTNGSPVSVPLQQRVLEYNEAGMGVAEIARELGIGKGEVRLMLSLAKQKGP